MADLGDGTEWTVSRRFRNFESLHRQLREVGGGLQRAKQSAPAGRHSGTNSLVMQPGCMVHLAAATKTDLRSRLRRLDKECFAQNLLQTVTNGLQRRIASIP